MKELSIIIPIYNMEQYLPECLSSLKQQNFDDSVEIILVDDGSTDGCLKICKEAASQDYHYRVIHQDNSGVAAARNAGLRFATGRYLAWIDPDDYITDDWWHVIKNELVLNPDMVYFDMYMLYNDKLKEIHYDNISRNISRRELFESLALDKIHSHLCSKIFRRSLFEMFFSTKYSFCEDYALLHHVVWNVDNCRYIHKPLYIYRQLNTSIVHAKENRLYNRRLGIRLHKTRYKFFKKRGIEVPYDSIYWAMYQYCYEYLKNSDNAGNNDEKIYRICMGLLRNNLFTLLRSKTFGIKQKVKIVLLTLTERLPWEAKPW